MSHYAKGKYTFYLGGGYDSMEMKGQIYAITAREKMSPRSFVECSDFFPDHKR